ncbi:response regulator transcription factor [Burkholderia humptydooensis]|uniref:response regulator transcription factor n=1 Tax=Burkholderia TaxID=32008 RepID=UPI001E4BA179|nr:MULTISPECIES: LuxR C-terminal-related transcriptional regulator [Burkholderia]
MPVDNRFKLDGSDTHASQADSRARSQRHAMPSESSCTSPKHRWQPTSQPTLDSESGQTPPKLSSRQQQILTYIIQGYQNKAIARLLGIEIVTVKMHIGVLFKKLGVRNRTTAAVRGIDLIRDKMGEESTNVY